MRARLEQLLRTTRLDQVEIAERTRRIYEALLRESPHLGQGNFTSIAGRDLRLLFETYDEAFLHGGCRAALADSPLTFRISRTMTKAAGKTSRSMTPDRSRPVSYEIAVSSTLLFQTFHEGERPITVTGLPCRNRLEALQRVFEHELVHLMEMIVWARSSCSAARFQEIAAGLFGHREHTHQLITAGEIAFTKLGIRPGSRVRFCLDGSVRVGSVNRISKRATVLVEDPAGDLHSDGRRYFRFYVPLDRLELEPS